MITLYKRNKNNSIQVWHAEVSGSQDEAFIVTQHGKHGGKLVTTTKLIHEKNYGKSNATTSMMQAKLEIDRVITAKREKGYFDTIDDAMSFQSVLPMKAFPYKDKYKKIQFPAIVQPKLNGVRCKCTKLAENKFEFLSNDGNDFPLLHKHQFLCDELNTLMQVGDIFDGELYRHGWFLQDIVSYLKRDQAETYQLEFWVFDFPISIGANNVRLLKDLQNADRQGALDRVFREQKSVNYFARPVSWYVVNDHAEIKNYLHLWTGEGFEGVIIRNFNGLYEYGRRSNDLIKWKLFEDDEYEIIGFESETIYADSKALDAIIYVCRATSTQTFTCRPKGKIKDRVILWNNRKLLLGKQLTVRHQGLSKDGVPLFPSGIVVRDYE